MKIVFLGTGTSTGVPQIGCRCRTCTSEDKKDKRLRSSLYVEVGSQKILIDSGPDFRQQMLTNNLRELSAILLTHDHYDHVGGLDDVRPLGDMDIYAEQNVINTVKRTLPYCFTENKYPGVPLLNMKEINENAFYLKEVCVQPIRVFHAKLPMLGFRIGKMAYLTDVKTISDDALKLLEGLDVLIINALRIEPHFSHLSLSEALDVIRKIAPKQAYLTHIAHTLGKHEEVQNTLPKNVYLSYDKLQLVL